MVQTDHRYIMSGLLEGWDWFDNGLQNLVKQAGFAPLNKSQSMMVLYVSAGVKRPSDIARKMRLSRQAIRHIANQLMELEILVSREDPGDGRSKVLDFAERSKAIRFFAQDAIHGLERVLRARIGRADYDALERVLKLDWGKIVASEKEMAPVGGLPREARALAKTGAAKRKRA